jgi:putative transcriptional regulator
MVQHDDSGALGLILNRPLTVTVKEVCRDALDQDCDVEGVLYQGGPCPGPLMAVHTLEAASQTAVMDGLHFTTEKDRLEVLLGDADATARFFVNYSGWTPGQVESEIEEGSWLTLSATTANVFSSTDDLWTRLSKAATLGKWIPLDRIPDDPSVN